MIAPPRCRTGHQRRGGARARRADAVVSKARADGRVVVATYRLTAATVVLAADPNVPQDPPIVAVRLSGFIHHTTQAPADGSLIKEDDVSYTGVLTPALVGHHYLLLQDVTNWVIS